MRTSAEERLVTQAGPSRASLFSLTLTGVLVLGRLEMIPARRVTITLGRGLGQARYEYLWKSSLVGVAAWKSSSTSERLHGRLGSHLGEEVAPAEVVDTRNHLGVDLGDGEA